MPKFLVEKLVSGGQTGADRAALNAAIALGLPHGGWCPKNRRAENGTIPDHYNLTETPGAGYPVRTEWNVRDSDGTVVLTLGELATGGSRKTIEIARRLRKPCLHISRDGGDDARALLRDFIARHGIRVLNVAGSRESKEPGIGAWVEEMLAKALSEPRRSGSGPSSGHKRGSAG
ncbi:MAG TPA: putative molybdenum carrier protein [Verrucomicrobiae bacterium]|nr:putative molybdenum carrier protein [Verrucomicrobiae bacterium]